MFSYQDVIKHSHIYEGQTVADFGFGVGEFTLFVANKVGSFGKVYAFDIQKPLVDRFVAFTKGAYPWVLPIWHDLEHERGIDNVIHGELLGKVDAVFIINSLFQMKHRDCVLNDAYRLLKIGGICCIVEWKKLYPGFGPEQDVLLSEDEIQALSAKVKLAYKESISISETHCIYILKKL